MVSSLLALILFISSSFSISAVDPVGLKIRITNNAQKMLKEQALAMFREKLVNKVLPDKVEKYGCTIRNLDLQQLGAIQGDLNFQDNSRIKFVIMDSTFSVSFDIKIPAMSEFKVTINAEKVKANMEVSLTRSAQGRLAIDMPVCEALAGKFLPITNGKQWPRIGSERFPQIFSFLFCRAVSWFVLPPVNRMLETTPMTTEVSSDFGIAIDYTLTRDVQMRATGLDLSFKGLVYRPADNINPPNPGVEPAFNENTRMAYVGVSDFLFNSAATAFYSAGALVKQLNSKALKRFLRFRQFFTEPWRLRDAVGAEIKLTEAPSFSITEKEGVTINLRAKLQDSGSGTRAPGKLLAVSMRCAVSMKVSTDGTHLFLPYDKVSCKIQTRNVVRDVLVKIVKTKVNKKISDFLEGFFKDGVKIPLPEGMIFTQQMITYHNGFVVLGGDLSFTAAGRQGMVKRAKRPGK